MYFSWWVQEVISREGVESMYIYLGATPKFMTVFHSS